MKQESLLERLSPDDRKAVIQAATRRKYRAGETVFHEGDPGRTMHLIVKGRVIIYVVTRNGDNAAVAVLRPGQCFGELAMFGGGLRSASVVALESLETLTIQHDRLDDHRWAQVVQRYLVESLAEQVGRLTARVLDAHFATAEQRVVRRLSEAVRLFADPPIEEVDTLSMTQQQLADFAGTTRPTVNRVLKDLELDGTISLGRGRIHIEDLARLDRLAR